MGWSWLTSIFRGCSMSESQYSVSPSKAIQSGWRRPRIAAPFGHRLVRQKTRVVESYERSIQTNEPLLGSAEKSSIGRMESACVVVLPG